MTLTFSDPLNTTPTGLNSAEVSTFTSLLWHLQQAQEFQKPLFCDFKYFILYDLFDLLIFYNLANFLAFLILGITSSRSFGFLVVFYCKYYKNIMIK